MASFTKMWSSFPDHIQYPTLESLYRMLGGVAEKNIDAPGFGRTGNTCASRISVALNGGGAPIARTTGIRSVSAADGTQIIFAVADLRRYLRSRFGRPATDITIPFNDAFAGKRGLIAFEVSGWSDASGHVALWNGRTFREPSHDDYASLASSRARTTRGEFWEF